MGGFALSLGQWELGPREQRVIKVPYYRRPFCVRTMNLGFTIHSIPNNITILMTPNTFTLEIDNGTTFGYNMNNIILVYKIYSNNKIILPS